MKQIAYPLVMVLILFALFLFSESQFSPLFQHCIERQEQYKAGAPAEKEPSRFSVLFAAYGTCTGSFIDANGNSITALATLIIAAFTGTLWVATSQQVKLTRDALELLERAYVDADTTHIMVGEQQLQYRVARVVNVVYELQNMGRTVAIITELHTEIRFSDSKSRLPDPPRVDAWRLPKTISIGPTVPFRRGTHEQIDQLRQDQLMAAEPTLFAHFFLYVGYEDALRIREPVVLSGIIAMRSGGRGVLEPYGD